MMHFGKISIIVLLCLLCSFSNRNVNQNIDNDKEIVEIYNTILGSLDKLYGKELKFIYVNDSIFNPEAGRWVTISGEMFSKFGEKDLVAVFKPNVKFDKFVYKSKLHIPCFLKEVKSTNQGKRKVSLSNDGRIVSFSNINVSSNNKLALVFIQIMGFKKTDYSNTLIILEKIRGSWYIVFLNTYEMT